MDGWMGTGSNIPDIFQTFPLWFQGEGFWKIEGCLDQTLGSLQNTPKVVSQLPTQRGGSWETTKF